MWIIPDFKFHAVLLKHECNLKINEHGEKWMRYIQIVTQNLKMLDTEGKSLSLKRQNNLSDLN